MADSPHSRRRRPGADPRGAPGPARRSPATQERGPTRQPGVGGRERRGRPHRDRDRTHRAGDGPAAGLGAADRSPETETHPFPFAAQTATAPAGSNGGPGIARPLDGVVLVLNQNYEPLNVCNIPRAFRLVFGSKAEVIEYDHATIRTVRAAYRAPSVIRLQHQVRRPRPRVKLTRREIFARDRHTCQYCGRMAHDLTLDHILPRHRGGSHSWENLVAACKPCNHRKGGRTPEEARLRLTRPAVRTAERPLLAVHARTSLTTGTRPGATTSSSAGTRKATVAAPETAAERLVGIVPGAVVEVLDQLHASGHAGYVVGGSLRDALLGRDPADWDLATDALPERSSGCSTAPSTRTGSGPLPSAATTTSSRSRPSARSTTTPTSAGRTGWSSART